MFVFNFKVYAWASKLFFFNKVCYKSQGGRGGQKYKPIKSTLRGGGSENVSHILFLLLNIQFLRIVEVKNLFDIKIKLQKILFSVQFALQTKLCSKSVIKKEKNITQSEGTGQVSA